MEAGQCRAANGNLDVCWCSNCGKTMEQIHRELASDLQALRKEVVELTKWRLEFEKLTPMGSEWVNDLPKCVEYVRGRFQELHEAKKNVVRKERELEALRKENEALRAMLNE